MLEEDEVLLPDPELPDSEAPELDQIEGLSHRMTQVMNNYQWRNVTALCVVQQINLQGIVLIGRLYVPGTESI